MSGARRRKSNRESFSRFQRNGTTSSTGANVVGNSSFEPEMTLTTQPSSFSSSSSSSSSSFLNTPAVTTTPGLSIINKKRAATETAFPIKCDGNKVQPVDNDQEDNVQDGEHIPHPESSLSDWLDNTLESKEQQLNSIMMNPVDEDLLAGVIVVVEAREESMPAKKEQESNENDKDTDKEGDTASTDGFLDQVLGDDVTNQEQQEQDPEQTNHTEDRPLDELNHHTIGCSYSNEESLLSELLHDDDPLSSTDSPSPLDKEATNNIFLSENHRTLNDTTSSLKARAPVKAASNEDALLHQDEDGTEVLSDSDLSNLSHWLDGTLQVTGAAPALVTKKDSHHLVDNRSRHENPPTSHTDETTQEGSSGREDDLIDLTDMEQPPDDSPLADKHGTRVVDVSSWELNSKQCQNDDASSLVPVRHGNQKAISGNNLLEEDEKSVSTAIAQQSTCCSSLSDSCEGNNAEGCCDGYDSFSDYDEELAAFQETPYERFHQRRSEFLNSTGNNYKENGVNLSPFRPCGGNKRPGPACKKQDTTLKNSFSPSIKRQTHRTVCAKRSAPSMTIRPSTKPLTVPKGPKLLLGAKYGPKCSSSQGLRKSMDSAVSSRSRSSSSGSLMSPPSQPPLLRKRLTAAAATTMTARGKNPIVAATRPLSRRGKI